MVIRTQNTFHHHASQRHSKNYIDYLKGNQANLHEDPDEIDEIAVQHFCSLFSASTLCPSYVEGLGEIEFRALSKKQHIEMVKKFEEREIVVVIHMMHPSKAPRPGGFHAGFY